MRRGCWSFWPTGAAGRRRLPGPRGLAPLLTFLRQVGASPAAQYVVSPLDAVLGRYRSWMARERGLSPSTMLRSEKTARRFLTEYALNDGVFSPGLTGADLNAFLLQECVRVSAGSAKGLVAELRSLMRFLHLDGVISRKLGAAVPPVGGWRLAAVPPRIAQGDVQRLLDHCPRQGELAVRDYAILMLVSRLGLRSVEVVRLEVGDVDWRSGEIVVRGKGRRETRLPLPAVVGEALVASRRGARGGAALAGGGIMTRLHQALEDYLQLRRSLGHTRESERVQRRRSAGDGGARVRPVSQRAFGLYFLP